MAETIKEFLVGIGYKVNEASLQTFVRGLAGVTAGVQNLNKNVTAATANTAAQLTAASAKVENLGKSTAAAGAQATVASGRITAFNKVVADLGAQFAKPLGLKIDDAMLRGIEDRLSGISGGFAGLAKEASVTGTAIVGSMLKVAGANEDIYYAAQRLRMTPNALKVLESGLESVGVSAEATRGALQGIDEVARKLGGERNLRSWIKGVTGTEAVTQWDKILAAARYLQQNLGKSTEQQARLQIRAWGIPDELAAHIARNYKEVIEAQKVAAETNKNFTDDAYKNSAKLRTAWSEFMETIKVGPRMIEQAFGPWAGIGMHAVGDLIGGIWDVINSAPEPVRTLLLGLGLLKGPGIVARVGVGLGRTALRMTGVLPRAAPPAPPAAPAAEAPAPAARAPAPAAEAPAPAAEAPAPAARAPAPAAEAPALAAPAPAAPRLPGIGRTLARGVGHGLILGILEELGYAALGQIPAVASGRAKREEMEKAQGGSWIDKFFGLIFGGGGAPRVTAPGGRGDQIGAQLPSTTPKPAGTVETDPFQQLNDWLRGTAGTIPAVRVTDRGGNDVFEVRAGVGAFATGKGGTGEPARGAGGAGGTMPGGVTPASTGTQATAATTAAGDGALPATAKGPALPGAPGALGEGLPSPGKPTADDPRGMIQVIRAAAIKHGIDPDVAVKVARSEGLLNFLGDKGKSGGAFQLYTGGGLGNEFQKETGLDPLDPKNEKATVDYAMREAAKGGWGPWHGAPRAGVKEWEGIGKLPPTADGGQLPTGGGKASAGGAARGVNPQLVAASEAAYNAILPPGYTAKVTSGERPGDPGFHGRGTALDWQIFDPQGKPIPNRGRDVTGLYGKGAAATLAYLQKFNPELAGKFGSGLYFGTEKGGGGELDIMHMDLGGMRGRRGDPRELQARANEYLKGGMFGGTGMMAGPTVPGVSVPGPQVSPAVSNVYNNGANRNATLNSTTNINVAGEPSTSTAYLDQLMRRNNADMVRNLSGAIA
jgi:hypothetical protein